MPRLLCLVAPFLWAISGQATSDLDAQVAVDAHNAVRREVASFPSNAAVLPPLSWDTQLAKIAQAWVDSCPGLKHNSKRSATYPTQVGENIYVSAGGKTSVAKAYQDASDNWQEEKHVWKYGPSGVADAVDGQVVGHYTQQIWATTLKIGCGTAFCTQNSPFGATYPDYQMTVCNYAGPGNYRGQYPYVVGSAPAPTPTPTPPIVFPPTPTPVPTPVEVPPTPVPIPVDPARSCSSVAKYLDYQCCNQHASLIVCLTCKCESIAPTPIPTPPPTPSSTPTPTPSPTPTPLPFDPHAPKPNSCVSSDGDVGECIHFATCAKSGRQYQRKKCPRDGANIYCCF